MRTCAFCGQSGDDGPGVEWMATPVFGATVHVSCWREVLDAWDAKQAQAGSPGRAGDLCTLCGRQVLHLEPCVECDDCRRR